jgi:hypothetical protein
MGSRSEIITTKDSPITIKNFNVVNHCEHEISEDGGSMKL